MRLKLANLDLYWAILSQFKAQVGQLGAQISQLILLAKDAKSRPKKAKWGLK